MSNGMKCLELNASDARKLLAAKAHLGNTNCGYQMAQYAIVLEELVCVEAIILEESFVQNLKNLFSTFFGLRIEWRLV